MPVVNYNGKDYPFTVDPATGQRQFGHLGTVSLSEWHKLGPALHSLPESPDLAPVRFSGGTNTMPTTSSGGLINLPSTQTTTPQAPAAPQVPNVSTVTTPPNGSQPFQPYPATTTTPTGYTPEGFTVAPNQTVQGQIENIIAKDSPLMQQAQTRAAQAANARGLLNSSIAVGAGQDAVINAALPIAQQDATAFNQAMTNTQNAKNAALNFNASQTNAINQANTEAINKSFADAFTANASYANIQLNNANAITVANIDANTKQALGLLDAQNKQLLQTNNSAAQAYVQAVQGIANIQMSSTMSREAKDAATASQLNMLNEQLRTLAGISSTAPGNVGSLNLAGYFQNLSPAPPPVSENAPAPSWYTTPPPWWNTNYNYYGY